MTMTPRPQIGICLWSVPEETDEARVRMAHRLGLNGLHIDLGPSDRDFPLTLPAVQERYKQWRDTLGLTYTTLGVLEFITCSLSDPTQHRDAFKTIEKAIEAAVAMEIPLLQFPSFGASAIDDARGFGATVEALRYACEKAGEHGLLVSSENVLDLQNQRLLIEMVDYANFRIYFDTANPKRMKNLNGPVLLEDGFDITAEVHLKEGFHNGPYAPLGKGETDFSGSMKILKSHQYDGWMHLENNYRELSEQLAKPIEELIREDIATAKSFFE